MSVRLDWQIDQDRFEELERPEPLQQIPTVARPGPGYILMGRDPELMRVGPLAPVNPRQNPARLYLIGSLILFGALILLCFLA